LRYAPSFKLGATSSRDEVAYTVETLAKFFGWKESKIETTLASLALIEEGLATDEQFDGLSTRQAKTVVDETRFAERETKDGALAQAVGKRISGGLKRASKGRDAVERRTPMRAT
jgi:hypothetical protein